MNFLKGMSLNEYFKKMFEEKNLLYNINSVINIETTNANEATFSKSSTSISSNASSSSSDSTNLKDAKSTNGKDLQVYTFEGGNFKDLFSILKYNVF